MPDRRPSETSTYFIGDPSETDTLHRRTFWNQHTPPETHLKPTCPIRDPLETDMPVKRWIMSRSPIRHVGLRWFSDQTCRSPIGHRWSVLVFNEACWSPMKHVEVSDGSPIRHVGPLWSMSRSPMGHRSGMLVSDGSLIGLWWVSDNNNIFENSLKSAKCSAHQLGDKKHFKTGLHTDTGYFVQTHNLYLTLTFFNKKGNFMIFNYQVLIESQLSRILFYT